MTTLSLDLVEQERSSFAYSYSVFQAEYSRNLLFTVGAQMDQVFDRAVDRTRSRLDVPTLRTLFGAKQRPGRNGTPDLSLRLAAVIETPRYDLTLFKVYFSELDAEGLHQRCGCPSRDARGWMRVGATSVTPATSASLEPTHVSGTWVPLRWAAVEAGKWGAFVRDADRTVML